jgi:Acyl-CoA dehydrogenase, N-terminal domain
MDVEVEGSRVLFTLPQELQELQRVVRRIVHEELLLLEPEYLLSAAPAHGVDSVVNLRGVFPAAVVDRLIALSHEAGLWDLHVPKQFGGGGLGLLGQVVVEEQLMYCAVPLPIANVPNILYECNEEQRQRFLLPVIRAHLLRPDGGEQRFGPGRDDADDGGAGRERLGPEREQDVHQRRGAGRYLHDAGGDGPGAASARGHHDVPRREGDARADGGQGHPHVARPDPRAALRPLR